jgi:molybdopterin molybdotransferase
VIEMIPFEEACSRAMRHARFLGAEEVPLAEALGRVLAEDAASDIDMPPFDKAAMDGFACRRTDLGGALRVVEELPAGTWPTRAIGEGECARIMTGAPVPEGADCVVMRERTREAPPGRVAVEGIGGEANICARGEDVRAGEVVLRAGTIVTPAAIGMLASIGRVRPRVARRPRVAVLTTGSEIVEPGEAPERAQIRNSNGPQLCAQAASAGALPTYFGALCDDKAVIAAALDRARRECDLVLLSGGVSVGDYDFVPEILRELGFDLEFHGVAMQPGKPTAFATDGAVACFGLPGNPVATFAVFELMVRPFIAGLMGLDFAPPIAVARLAGGIARRNAERRLTVPVRFLEPGRVAPLDYHGSAHLASIARAEGLVAVPVGVREIPAGEVVHVRLV